MRRNPVRGRLPIQAAGLLLLAAQAGAGQITCPVASATVSNGSSGPLAGAYCGDNYVQSSGTATVNAGGNVSFRAGKAVSLEPGFRAAAGSTFRAYIQPPTLQLSVSPGR